MTTRIAPTLGAVLALAAAVVAVTGYATRVGANPVQCAVTRLNMDCGYTVATPGGDPAPAAGGSQSPGPPADTPQPDAAPTAFWVREPFNRHEAGGDANLVGLDDCTTPDGQPGTRYRDTLISPSGEVLDTATVCAGEPQPAAPGGAITLAPVPPPPPTREELLARSPIPQPVIERNPANRGLTGLASWFWASMGTTVDASVSLRGWTVTGTLGLGSLDWDTGDGGTYHTTQPGTPDTPAVEHTYTQDGTWPVTLDVSWSGSYTITGYGTTYTVEGRPLIDCLHRWIVRKSFA